MTVRPRGPLGVLSPFAFYVGPRRPVLRPNDGEVEAAWWVPLSHLWDEAHRGTIDWEYRGQWMRFPGIRFEGHVIWGLTYRVLTQWSQQLGRPLPAGLQGTGGAPFERL